MKYSPIVHWACIFISWSQQKWLFQFVTLQCDTFNSISFSVLWLKYQFIFKRIWAFYNVKNFIHDYGHEFWRNRLLQEVHQVLNYGFDELALSWMRFIWLFNFRLWKIETTGAWENWDVMKAFRRSKILHCREILHSA